MLETPKALDTKKEIPSENSKGCNNGQSAGNQNNICYACEVNVLLK
jgi:hypothetical protein